MTQTNKFKVGDKVRCIDEGGNSYITIGEEYIVKAVHGSDFIRTNCDKINEYYFYKNELFELVEEPKPKIARDFPEKSGNPNKVHKHKDLIIAWANGAAVEYKSSTGLWREEQNPWWDEDTEFRIKPEPKPDVVKTMFVEANPCLDNAYNSHNLKLTFCAETGKLKSAEVIS